MSASTIIDRIRTLLENTAPFDRLPAEERAEIFSDMSIQYFDPGEVIMEQGATVHPGLFIVESGLVRLMDVVRQHLIDKVGEGDVFGSFGLLKGGATIYEAKAVEPTVCAVLKGERFQKLYDRYEEFAAYFDNDIKMYVRRMGVAMDVTGAHLLFSRSLNQFVHRELVACEPETTARQAATLMRREGVDAVLVVQNGRVVGIMTDGDLRNRLVAKGSAPDTPVRRLMSSPVYTIDADASIYNALVMMLQRRIHRLVIVQRGEEDEVVGMITDRDVAHFRGQDPVATVERIDHAQSVAELASIRQRTNEQLLNLWRQGVQPEMVHRIMMVFYDRIAVRVLELVEKGLRARAADLRVDLPWVWMRVGSGGRQEMAFTSVQHNALVYANPSSEEEAQRAEQWFDLIAEEANEALEACGFNPSEFVARDPRWRRSLRQWKQTYRAWILQADEAALVLTPAFFDLRGVYGEVEFVDELKEDIIDALNVQEMDQQRAFLRMMAANALEHSPSTSFFRKVLGRVSDSRHTLDLRESGLVPVVDAARVLALESRYLESTNTFDRLRHAADALPELSKTIDDALSAYQYIVDFRLESQLRAVEAGDPPLNQIEASSLNRMQYRLLRDAFSRATSLLDAVARHYDLPRR